jgi:hypothetical protein
MLRQTTNLSKPHAACMRAAMEIEIRFFFSTRVIEFF